MLEIAVGPPHIVTNQGHTVLVTEPDGQIPLRSQKGLYFRDTRLLSQWSLCVNGQPWELLNSGNLDHYASRVFLTNRDIVAKQGTIPHHTLQLVLSRSIDEGMHEDIDIINYGTESIEFILEISIQSDFADLFEVKSGHSVQRGVITSQWSAQDSSLRTIYRNEDFCREIAVLIRASGSTPVYANGRISFAVALGRRESWHTCVLYEFGNGKVRTKAPSRCIADSTGSRVGQRLEQWRTEALKLQTSNELVGRLFEQALDDVASLRMAEIFDELGEPVAARKLRSKATALFNRFNEASWDEEAGIYAYALDGKKRKVLTVASNPGHCLWYGIVAPERAGKIVRRLMASDMWSGWGIRTLSADHPAFNPLSYQNGSVWPHDNGLIALGMRRYGFAAEACQVARRGGRRRMLRSFRARSLSISSLRTKPSATRAGIVRPAAARKIVLLLR